MKNNFIKKIINSSTFLLFLVFIAWSTIISTLHQGVSCDEGYYLMSYLTNQHPGNFISDFGRIIRVITPDVLENNIMTYRYERLLLSLLVFPFFAFSLRRWLSKYYNLVMDTVTYYSLVLLVCAMSYTFAAPTISYDSLQTFIYLLSFSFFFLAVSVEKRELKKFFLGLTGFFSFFGIMNYFPSGVFLIVCVFCLIWIYNQQKKFIPLLFYVIGMVVSVVIYHFFINNLVDYTSLVWKTLISVFTEKSASRHDAGGLMSSLLLRIGLFLLYVPFIWILSHFIRKTRIKNIHVYILAIFIALCLLLFRSIYYIYAPVFYFFIAVLLATVIAYKNIKIREIRKYKQNAFFVVLFTITPFFAVLGTNQNLFIKMLIFLPFWLVVYLMLYSFLNSNKIKDITLVLFGIMLFAGYIYLGNFSRYHYYYTPRSSKYTIENLPRPQKITFSQYQKDYFRDVETVLQENGAQKGDKYLAFGENQMAVFLMGGYITGKLPYHWFQYKDFTEEQAPKFFILFKNEEKNVIKLLSKSDWGFPAKYKRIEMRPMSENMDNEELKTIIYVPNR